MSKSMIIIGGGIAGLTAAYRLKQVGVKVTLLEKNSRLGGAIYSEVENEYLMEKGPNTILETSPLVTKLVQDLGIEDEKLYANESSKIRYIVRDKKPVPLPSSPLAFVTSPLFSILAKLRLIKEPFIDAWDNQYEESLSQFVIRRLGQEFLDYAINPFVAGVYAGDPDQLSVKHGFPKLYALEQKYGSLIKGQIKGAKERKQSDEESKQNARMFSFLKGLKTLPEALGKELGSSIFKQARVLDITFSNGIWQVTYNDSDNRQLTVSGNAVLYTGKVNELDTLTINNKPETDFGLFKEIYYPPVSVLTLGFKKEDVDHPLDGFGMLIPKVEGFQTLGTLFSSTLFPGRAPDGHVLLTIFIGGSRQPENGLKPESELVEMALADYRVLLGVKSTPSFVHTTQWKEAIPQYEVGYGKYKDILDRMEEQHPGLFFAGNFRNGISVADTIVNSEEVTSRIKSFYLN